MISFCVCVYYLPPSAAKEKKNFGDTPTADPVKSAFSYRREQLGSELLEELFAQCAGPKATQQTPGAFWRGLRRLSIDGTVESVPDTPGNRVAFRYSTDDAESQSPFPQARLVLLVECGTHLICDAELSSCRQGEASSLRLLLERWRMEQSLLLWDSGFHSSWAIFEVCARGGHVLGRLKKNVLLTPFVTLADGSYLTYIYQDQDHHTGACMLVRVISYTFTDARIPGRANRSIAWSPRCWTRSCTRPGSWPCSFMSAGMPNW